MLIPARQAYLETEVLQAEPMRLTQLLYRGALAAIAQAREHLRQRNIPERSRQITRAGEILLELSSSLDLDRGGDVALNLARLYDYMQRQLHQANFEQREEPLVEVEGLLATLLDAWEKCAPPEPSARLKDPEPVAGFGDADRAPIWQMEDRAASYAPLSFAG